MKRAIAGLLLALPMPAVAEPIQGPPRDAGFMISLSNPDLQPQSDIGVTELDLFDAEQPTIDALRAAGGYVVCYFSAGSIEDWRPDAAQFPQAAIGKEYEGWPGERWLDIRALDALAPVLSARLDLARQKRCDAVDPDNVDGFSTETGFDISQDQQRGFNAWLAGAAHDRGLAIGLKNAVELVPDLLPVFDFAVIESCAAEESCDRYAGFADSGKAVFQIEYRAETKNWRKVCKAASDRGFTAVLADLELDGKLEACPRKPEAKPSKTLD